MVTRTITLTEALRAARKRKGWTQGELAWQLHTSEKNVRNWEAGRHEPSLPMYMRLCLLFEWPVGYSGSSSNPGYLGFGAMGSAVQPIGGPRVAALAAATS